MKLDFTYIFAFLENIKQPSIMLYKSVVLSLLQGGIHRPLQDSEKKLLTLSSRKMHI